MKSLPGVSRTVMAGSALCALFALQVIPAHAINVHLVGSNSAGQDWTGTPEDWSNGLPASAGNDYYVDPNNLSGLFSPPFGSTLRTPQDVSSTFPGDALYLYDGGQLALKSGHLDTVTFNNLIVDGGWINGSINSGAPELNQEVAGNISVTSNGIQLSSNRALVSYSALISGSGPMTILDRGDDEPYSLSFTNASNTWTGDLTVLEDDAEVTIAFGNATTLDAVDLGSEGILDLNGQNLIADTLFINGAQQPFGTLTETDSLQITGLGSIQVLNGPPPPQEGDVNLDGDTNILDYEIIRDNLFAFVGANARTSGDLNNDQVVDFADFRLWKNAPQTLSSTASVPEPHSLALVVAASCALLRGRRR